MVVKLHAVLDMYYQTLIMSRIGTEKTNADVIMGYRLMLMSCPCQIRRKNCLKQRLGFCAYCSRLDPKIRGIGR